MNMPKNVPQHRSLTTLLEKRSYGGSKNDLNFTYGYPEGLNPAWIRQYQTHPPENFLDVAPETYLNVVEGYFRSFFRATHVNVTPTCSLAFTLAMQAIIQAPGDEIILLDATYDSYPYIVQTLKGKAVYARRGEHDTLSVEHIRECYADKTRAVVLCCPENPLGVIYSQESLEQVIAFCKEKALTLVVDNCFAEISPFGNEVPVVSRMPASKGLSYMLLGDTGKILGLKGSKFGAVVYSDGWGEALEAVQSTLFFQYNQYDLYLLSSVLGDERFPAYLADTNKQIAENYQYLKTNLHAPMRTLPLQGSCFALIDMQALAASDVAYARALMEERGVIVIPKSYFHTGEQAQSTCVRISLARDAQSIRQLAVIMNEFAGELLRRSKGA